MSLGDVLDNLEKRFCDVLEKDSSDERLCEEIIGLISCVQRLDSVARSKGILSENEDIGDISTSYLPLLSFPYYLAELLQLLRFPLPEGDAISRLEKVGFELQVAGREAALSYAISFYKSFFQTLSSLSILPQGINSFIPSMLIADSTDDISQTMSYHTHDRTKSHSYSSENHGTKE